MSDQVQGRAIEPHSTVRNLSDFLATVQRLQDEWTNSADWYPQLWFRGHADARWSLEPSLHRLIKDDGDWDWRREYRMVRDFRMRAELYMERAPQTDWEWLYWAQHHGLPTRLLDWTQSALVGLWFAVKPHAQEWTDGDGNAPAATVWVMNPWWLNATRRSTDSWMPDLHELEAYLPRDSEEGPPRPVKCLSGKINSRRIAAQRGTFVVFGKEKSELMELQRLTDAELVRIDVPANRVRSLIRELDNSGISETSIFPDLEGLCREVRDLHFPH